MTPAERIKIWKEKGEVMIAGGCYESDYEDFISVLLSEIHKRDEALRKIVGVERPRSLVWTIAREALGEE